MRVIALDPGITTGYSIGDISEDGEMVVLTGEAKWQHIDLWHFLHENKPEISICEHFVYRNKARPGLELFSRELIGVTALYTQLTDTKLTMQNALKSNETTYFNDNRLKKDHIFKTDKGHANDAARHILTWFQFRSGFQYNKKGYKSGVAL